MQMPVQDALIRDVLATFNGSDAGAAQACGVKTQTFHAYKKGTRKINETDARKIACFLGRNEKDVVLSLKIEQAEDNEMKAFWRHFGKAAAIAAITIGMMGASAISTPDNSREMHIMSMLNSRLREFMRQMRVIWQRRDDATPSLSTLHA